MKPKLVKLWIAKASSIRWRLSDRTGGDQSGPVEKIRSALSGKNPLSA
jgi:hypothetical protein